MTRNANANARAAGQGALPGAPNRPRLADHNADIRMVLLAGMALVTGTGGALAAWVLLHMIGLTTNLLWYHTLSWAMVSPGEAATGPLTIVIPVAGSRPSEIERMTPLFEASAARVRAEQPDVALAVVIADTVAAQAKAAVAGWPFRAIQVEGEAAKKDAMKAATVALACSGTVSTELALAGAPMVIAYRLSGLSYALIKPMLSARHITLFNIAADARIAPEFVQDEATPEALAAAVLARLGDPALRADQVRRQSEALDLMGRDQPDPSAAAAEAVLKVVGRI